MRCIGIQFFTSQNSNFNSIPIIRKREKWYKIKVFKLTVKKMAERVIETKKKRSRFVSPSFSLVYCVP